MIRGTRCAHPAKVQTGFINNSYAQAHRLRLWCLCRTLIHSDLSSRGCLHCRWSARICHIYHLLNLFFSWPGYPPVCRPTPAGLFSRDRGAGRLCQNPSEVLLFDQFLLCICAHPPALHCCSLLQTNWEPWLPGDASPDLFITARFQPAICRCPLHLPISNPCFSSWPFSSPVRRLITARCGVSVSFFIALSSPFSDLCCSRGPLLVSVPVCFKRRPN